ncbi:IMP dehydrogenase [Longimycelium tulufanense]|uniref:IMP dehydrogenase n=1 Tax=Longimycelium tulufanense TaxID=907463 RepID=A0A8J3CJD5_9PSEU|nr:alcohol dehydrogenase catalytic domain-containing protein [Longimycelium tulufanense]GGM76094.1 IMP dehydrogenase [Longimycelium tulufanense]
MLASVAYAPGDLRVEQVPDPVVVEPTDAVVRVVLTCVCGSDLWGWRGIAPFSPGRRTGHEFLGVVEQVGPEVRDLRPGQLVVAPFAWSDGTCHYCRRGLQTSCVNGGVWGEGTSDGGQAEAVRVPCADGTLVPLPEGTPVERLRGVLALSDVFPTGHHAAKMAGVAKDATVAVVGDGAVGLCGVLASARLGASRIIAMSRHEDRAAVAKRFGATDVVAERGDEAIARVREITDGIGVDCVLECVGTDQAMATALGIATDGGQVGAVGVPYEVSTIDVQQMFSRNLGLRVGVAPARAYIEELLPDVLSGRFDPVPVFDHAYPLAEVPRAYRDMSARTTLKALVEVSTP